MTTTTNGTYAIGTRAMVECDTSALPARRRHEGRVPAVRTQYDWVALWANPEGDDWIDSSQWGWLLTSNLTSEQIDTCGIRDLVTTHRGWHLTGVHSIDPIAITEAMMPTVESLQAEIIRLKAEHEAFKVRASDILGAEASDHDLCEAYDNIAEQAGLYRRPSRQEVEIQVTYRQTVTLVGRSYEETVAEVRGLSVSRLFEPPHPFQGGVVEETGGAYSVEVTVPGDTF